MENDKVIHLKISEHHFEAYHTYLQPIEMKIIIQCSKKQQSNA